MGWVRDNRRFGGWLALAALALQLIVSFGHVHLSSLHHRSPTVTIADAGAQASQPQPAQQPDADDYCAICATIHLAATSFVPQPPHLPLPFGFECLARAFAAAFGIAEPRRVAFHSRAPPLV